MKKMKFTIPYKKWSIVLVPFPFTDLSEVKRRPALILSPDEYNQSQDVVIAFITSKLDLKPLIGDYRIKEWEKANLPKPSIIRMKFATIDKSIISRQLGQLTDRDSREFSKLLVNFFSYN